jgi:hypothetical protein
MDQGVTDRSWPIAVFAGNRNAQRSKQLTKPKVDY